MKFTEKIAQKGNSESIKVAVEEIPINSITVKYHPRKDLGNLGPLGHSINKLGLQGPLIVFPVGEGQYAIIDGQRRIAACKKLKMETVPCIIKNVDDATAAGLSYVINSERNALSSIEEAMHLRYMQEHYGFTLDELFVKGHGTPSLISQKIKLLKLPDSVQTMITGGVLTPAHGRELLRLSTSGEQEKMAKQVVDLGMTAKRTQVKVSKYIAKKNKSEKAPPDKTIPLTEVPGVYFKDSSGMIELPNDSVQLLVTSPPHNLGKEFEEGVPHDVHLHEIQAVLKESARVLAPGCIMALNVAEIWNFRGVKGQNDFTQVQLMGHKYQSMLRKHHIYLTDVIIWVKNKSWRKIPRLFYSDETVHTTYGMLEHFEPVYIFRKRGEREIPPEDVVLSSRLTKEEWASWIPAVWQIQTVRDMSEHPSIYPDELVMRLVKMFSYEGDTVLDPWLGSGTTVKVARELRRNGIGYERDLRYKSLIMKKLGVKLDEAEEKSGPMVEYFTNAMSKSDDPDTTDIEDFIKRKRDSEAEDETFDLEDFSEEEDLATV